MKTDINALIAQAVGIIETIVGLCLLLLIAGATARAMRLGINFLPSVGTTELAYLCGAWWLLRGKR